MKLWFMIFLKGIWRLDWNDNYGILKVQSGQFEYGLEMKYSHKNLIRYIGRKIFLQGKFWLVLPDSRCMYSCQEKYRLLQEFQVSDLSIRQNRPKISLDMGKSMLPE